MRNEVPSPEQPSPKQIEGFIRQVFEQSGLPVDRCSRIFFQQLSMMPNRGRLNMPFQFVQQEIGNLEGKGKTSTKPAKPFSTNGPLKGLIHKHFFVSTYGHLGANAVLAWKLDVPDSPKINQMLGRVMKPYRGREVSEAEAQKLSRQITDELLSGPGGLRARLAGKATGDWIVYLQHDAKNYYLCIAKHGQEGFILEAVRCCLQDFPFISNYVAL